MNKQIIALCVFAGVIITFFSKINLMITQIPKFLAKMSYVDIWITILISIGFYCIIAFLTKKISSLFDKLKKMIDDNYKKITIETDEKINKKTDKIYVFLSQQIEHNAEIKKSLEAQKTLLDDFLSKIAVSKIIE